MSSRRTTSSGPRKRPVGSPGSTARSITASSPPDALLQAREHLGRGEARLPRDALRDRPHRRATDDELGLATRDRSRSRSVSSAGGRDGGAHAVGRDRPGGGIPPAHRRDGREHRQHAAAVGRRDGHDRQLLRLVDGRGRARPRPRRPSGRSAGSAGAPCDTPRRRRPGRRLRRGSAVSAASSARIGGAVIARVRVGLEAPPLPGNARGVGRVVVVVRISVRRHPAPRRA